MCIYIEKKFRKEKMECCYPNNGPNRVSKSKSSQIRLRYPLRISLSRSCSTSTGLILFLNGKFYNNSIVRSVCECKRRSLFCNHFVLIESKNRSTDKFFSCYQIDYAHFETSHQLYRKTTIKP